MDFILQFRFSWHIFNLLFSKIECCLKEFKIWINLYNINRYFRRYQFMFSKVINRHNLLNLGLHHCCNFWVGNRFLVKIDSFSQHTSKCLISSTKVSNCPILLIKRMENDIITSFWYGISHFLCNRICGI